MRNRILLFLVLTLPPLASGCVTAQFVKPTASFQKSAAATTGAVADFYQTRNRFERDLYFDDLAADPAKTVLLVDAEGKPTPLGGVLKAPAIQARLDLLDLVNVYASRLLELAGSDSPAKFAAASEVLGKNLTELSTTLQNTAGSDADVAKYIGPTTTLIGVVGEMILEAKRDAALTKAINDGDPAVRKILEFLRDDLAKLGMLDNHGVEQKLAAAVADYEARRAGLTPAQRRALLADIGVLATAYEGGVGANPAGLLSAMLAAHSSMVKFARSDRRPSDLAEMTAVLEAFAARASRVSDAINQLRNKGN